MDSSRGQHAVETLVKAFWNELPFVYYFPEEAARGEIAPYLMSMTVYSGIRYGEVHATSPDTEGIAIWIHSDNYPITLWRFLRSVPFSVIIGTGKAGGYRMKGLGQYLDARQSKLASFKHVYLQSLGVAAEFQGKGYAGRLLRHMLNRLDKAGMPCYLETLEEKKVCLYGHFGFVVVEESKVPGTSLTVWAMLRKPAGYTP